MFISKPLWHFPMDLLVNNIFVLFLNVEKKNFKITMVEFQQQSPHQLVNEYGHMNCRNDRLDLRLNSLQRENYFI